jgi:hypothetical protein
LQQQDKRVNRSEVRKARKMQVNRLILLLKPITDEKRKSRAVDGL